MKLRKRRHIPKIRSFFFVIDKFLLFETYVFVIPDMNIKSPAQSPIEPKKEMAIEGESKLIEVTPE